MRIEAFWADGYRSLSKIRIENLGKFNVFYGPNGSGKSNILEAIRALCGLAPLALAEVSVPFVGGQELMNEYVAKTRGQTVMRSKGGPLRDEDLSVHSVTQVMTLGARLSDVIGMATTYTALTLEVKVDLRDRLSPQLSVEISAVSEAGTPWDMSKPVSKEATQRVYAALREVCPSRLFALIGADRTPREEQMEAIVDPTDPVRRLLDQGELKRALLTALTSRDPEIRHGFKLLRELLTGDPLRRPPFDPVQDPVTGMVDLRESIKSPNGIRDVSIDLAGLGVVQLYTILAKALLSRSRVIAVEEPEAHLHARTSGLHLRTLLQRLVDEGHIDQLFIATHSNLYDLDEGGYWDVSLVDGETRIARKNLDEIDTNHLYEPGPAKHILIRMLMRYGDEFVFRTADGARLRASEMIEALRQDTPVAVEFLRMMHSTALETMAMRAQDEDGPEQTP